MEQITGRLVRAAEIKTTKGGKEFVVFTVAVNDGYKPKNRHEKRKARFFNCAYWLNTKIQPVLKRGSIVSVFGYVNLNAYKGTDGEYHANLTFHANYIELFGSTKKDEEGASQPATVDAAGIPEIKEGLPF